MPPGRSSAARLYAMDELKSNTILQNTIGNSRNINGNIYKINFGSQFVNIKTSYREMVDPRSLFNNDPAETDLQGYVDLRATSGLVGTSLASIGEMSYSVLNPFAGDMRPARLRFGLTNRWRDLTYGADFKSVTKGFISNAGSIADQSRDEGLIWGEHGVGPFNLRGSIGESWERLTDVADLRVTRTVAAALQIDRARWGGSIFSSYGLIGQGSSPNEESAVYINGLTTSYRPSDFLLFEPNFSVKEEWKQSTGVRTQTPASGFALIYIPRGKSFRLTGGTSFSRTFSRDGSNDVSIHGTSAAVDWKIGKFLGQNDTLSFTFNYDRQLDRVFRANSYDGLSSMLQLKIAGF